MHFRLPIHQIALRITAPRAYAYRPPLDCARLPRDCNNHREALHTTTCLFSTLNVNKLHAGHSFHPDRRHNLDPGGVSVTPGFGGRGSRPGRCLSPVCRLSLRVAIAAPRDHLSLHLCGICIQQFGRGRLVFDSSAFALACPPAGQHHRHRSQCPVFDIVFRGLILVSSFLSIFGIHFNHRPVD